MSKIVIYYSRAFENSFAGKTKYVEVGNTQLVAEVIAKKLGAELFEIKQKVPYAEDYITCINQSKKDLRDKVRPEIVAVPDNLDQYNEIYLGYPIYWGTMPMAVYTFLESCDLSNKTIYPFCTHEGSGIAKTVEDIEKVVPKAIVKRGLAINGSRVEESRGQIEAWCEKA